MYVLGLNKVIFYCQMAVLDSHATALLANNQTELELSGQSEALTELRIQFESLLDTVQVYKGILARDLTGMRDFALRIENTDLFIQGLWNSVK